LRNPTDLIHTRIWLEEPEADNPFAAARCYCSGYDVFGELLGNVSWVQYLYLMFRLELPSTAQARMLEALAVAAAHPGIRDHSVRAAMDAGVGGSTRASALMAALAVGAGNLGGAHEAVAMIRLWSRLGTDLEGWRAHIAGGHEGERSDVWFELEHLPGFDPNGVSCPQPVRQTLALLASHCPVGRVAWLRDQRDALEQAAGYPLAMSGVVATALLDLGFDEAQAEMLFLLLRLPGAAAQAIEQEGHGWRHYPFFGGDLKPMADDAYRALMESLEKRDGR